MPREEGLDEDRSRFDNCGIDIGIGINSSCFDRFDFDNIGDHRSRRNSARSDEDSDVRWRGWRDGAGRHRQREAEASREGRGPATCRRTAGPHASPAAAASPGSRSVLQRIQDDHVLRRIERASSRAAQPQVGALLRREAMRLQFLDADERIANVDGASWIPPQLDAAQLQLHGRGLDFYHLAENVHDARRSVFGSENPAGQTWAAALLHTFKHEGYEAAHEHLLKWLTPLRSHKRAAAKQLLNYITERRDMINYPKFATNGWQIGSGPTEARCKTGTTRLKRSGARWNLDNAESVAALTNLRDSNQWQPYWATPNAAKL